MFRSQERSEKLWACKGLAKRSQYFNATSCNIVAWCFDSYWTGWPNARNIHHNMSLFMSPRPLALGCRPKISMEDFEWYRASGPSAHALAQQCCVNVAKRVQHHATSKMLHEKFDHFQIWSNIIQHVATHRNISQQGGQLTQHVVPNNVARCCVEMLRAFGQALMMQFYDCEVIYEMFHILNCGFWNQEVLVSRGHGFKPRWSPDFFRLLYTQLLKLRS